MTRDRVWHRRDGREVVWYRRLEGDEDEGLRNLALFGLLLTAATVGAVAVLFFAQRAQQPVEAVLYLVGLVLGGYIVVVLGSLVMSLFVMGFVLAIARTVGRGRLPSSEAGKAGRRGWEQQAHRYQLRVATTFLALFVTAGVLLDLGQTAAAFTLVTVDAVVAPFAMMWTVALAARHDEG